MNGAILLYIFLINLIGFIMMAWDKEKAKKEQWRVPERRFFLIALFGGSIGCWLGMQKYRHKTKHPKFVIGIPLIILIQLSLILILYGKLFWIK